jgi:hypothetical protein
MMTVAIAALACLERNKCHGTSAGGACQSSFRGMCRAFLQYFPFSAESLLTPMLKLIQGANEIIVRGVPCRLLHRIGMMRDGNCARVNTPF